NSTRRSAETLPTNSDARTQHARPGVGHFRWSGFRLVEVSLQAGAGAWVAELAKGLGLDLANSLAGDPEVAAHFLERAEPAIVQAVPKHDDLAFALGELVQRVDDLRLQQLLSRKFDRGGHGVIFDEVAEERIA